MTNDGLHGGDSREQQPTRLSAIRLLCVKEIDFWLCPSIKRTWIPRRARNKVDFHYPLLSSLLKLQPSLLFSLCSSFLGGIKSMKTALLYSVVKYIP